MGMVIAQKPHMGNSHPKKTMPDGKRRVDICKHPIQDQESKSGTPQMRTNMG
jgi:hypothetical protein